MKMNKAFKISLISVIMGITLGLIVVALSGRNPMDMISAFMRSMTGFNMNKPENPVNMMFVLNWLLESMPIILTGLSVGFAYRTGLFNIGAEGQYLIGSACAALGAFYLDFLPPFVHVIACIIAAMIGGAIWGFLPGFLKAYRGIHEVVICIMMNYIGMHTANLMVKYLMPVDANTLARTIEFPASATISRVTAETSSNFNWGFVLVLLALVFYWFLLEKTTFGYSLRATGFNAESARFAGMKVKKNIVSSMMISGSLSGAAGAVVILGVFKFGRIYTGFDNYGFDGIAVALVGSATALGIGLAGLLFGLLKSSNNSLQILGIPKEISELIQASIIFFVSIKYGIDLLLTKFGHLIKGRKNKDGGKT